jgi:hypothetical protein
MSFALNVSLKDINRPPISNREWHIEVTTVDFREQHREIAVQATFIFMS